jgi:glycosyltransferase involved in cell wall biosynthesis
VKLLMIADVAATGFGRVGRELGSGLMALGWDVRVIGINWRGVAGEIASVEAKGPDAMRAVLDTMAADPLMPFVIPASANGDGMGHNLTAPAIRGQVWRGWVPDRVLLIADPRAALDRLTMDEGACGSVRTWNYVPIEGTGLPPLWRDIWDIVEPVAMSEFGRAQLQALMGRPVALVPHGVSTPFHPVTVDRPGSWRGEPVTGKADAKERLGWAGRTVILRTDRFVKRKNYAGLFRIMRPVLAAHPDALLVLHCAAMDEGGILDELISREPGAVRTSPGRWMHPQVVLTRGHDTFRGLSDADLNVLYNAADLYVSPTMAEGFGLCLAESLAAGVPVVTTDYAAGPEVCGPGAVTVPITGTWTNEYAHEWGVVDEAAFSAAVEHLITHPAARAELSAAGRRHVARYSWGAAADQFDTILRADPA